MHVTHNKQFFFVKIIRKLKGQCHDIQWFLSLFCASKKWQLLAQVPWTSNLLSLAGRAAWQPHHLRCYWHCSELTTSRARVALLHFSTATGGTFVFRLRGPSKVISPSSRFKTSSESDIDSSFSCFVLRAFRSLFRRSRRREHRWLGEGIGSVVVAPFSVTLTMCVTVKANALHEERVRGRDLDVRADLQTSFVVAFAQYVANTWRFKKCTCGKLWGRPDRRPRKFEGDAQGPYMSVQLLSARRCTFEHCTSCCPSRDATIIR